jgi:TPR repeat protein
MKWVIVIGSAILIGMTVLILETGGQDHLSKDSSPVSTKEVNNTEENYSDEFKQILKECDSGDVKACNKATTSFYNFGDMEHVIAISKRMCNQGQGSYCADLGSYYTDGIKGTVYDPKNGYEYYKYSCDLGNKDGCAGLKEFSIIQGQVVHNTASKISKKIVSCNNGESSSCIDLGEIYHHGIGVAIDTKRAMIYYKKGCNTKELNTDRRCEGYYEIMENHD